MDFIQKDFAWLTESTAYTQNLKNTIFNSIETTFKNYTKLMLLELSKVYPKFIIPYRIRAGFKANYTKNILQYYISVPNYVELNFFIDLVPFDSPSLSPSEMFNIIDENFETISLQISKGLQNILAEYERKSILCDKLAEMNLLNLSNIQNASKEFVNSRDVAYVYLSRNYSFELDGKIYSAYGVKIDKLAFNKMFFFEDDKLISKQCMVKKKRKLKKEGA